LQRSLDRPIIVDASVLIDYRDTDIGILSLFSKHIRPCYVNRSTLRKVKGITETRAIRCGLKVIVPTMELAFLAAQQKGPLSPDDWETVLLAEDRNLICLTNDKGMRAECERHTVGVLWGLEPLKILAAARIIDTVQALQVAHAIHMINPKSVNLKIVSRFQDQISVIANQLDSR